MAATAAAALLFGLAPALHAATVDTRGGLQETVRSSLSRGKRGVLSTLVCEIALALMLLVSSGLLVQAFGKVLHTDPGFRPENVMTWSLRLPGAKYAFLSAAIARLRALPGVTAASAAWRWCPSGWPWAWLLHMPPRIC